MHQTVITKYNQKILINHHADHIGRIISKHKDFYESGMLKYIDKNIKKSGTYVDVGANIGNHTLFFSLFCADRVISVEPVKDNYTLIEKNILDNKLDNVILYKKGISSDGRTFSVKKRKDNMGMCNLVEGGVDVKTVIPDELNLDNIRLIKIDCEGMSIEVFNAFIPLINTHKPDIFIEADNKELIYILNKINYTAIRKFNATPTYHIKPKTQYL